MTLLPSPTDDKLTTIPYLSSLKDLKQPYHLLNKNNEELKRLAAVESLMEVSAEENVSLMTLSIIARLAFLLVCPL